jgi:transposase
MLLAHTHASPFDHVTNIHTNLALPRRQFWKFTAAQAKAARAQIAVALLETSLHRRHRNRLLAIDAALASEPVTIIAARSQLKVETIRIWVRKMLRSGIDSVIPQSPSRIKPGSIPATEQEIEAALANATSRKVRKRLIALLAILQGQTVPAAAHTASASEAAVTQWLKRLRTEGLSPLLTTYPPGVRRHGRVPRTFNSGIV